MAANLAQTGWSQDGNWFWDGARWNDAVSGDGRWRFDGSAWQPFNGARTPMPIAPIAASVPTVAAGPEELPSWVAAAEVERLQREQAERDRAKAAAAARAGAAAPRPAHDSLGNPLVAGWTGVRFSFGLLGTVVSEVGIVGSLVMLGLVVNTVVALSRPIGSSHWVVPWATIAVAGFRAWRGKWFAAIALGVTWMLAVLILFIAGR